MNSIHGANAIEEDGAAVPAVMFEGGGDGRSVIDRAADNRSADNGAAGGSAVDSSTVEGDAYEESPVNYEEAALLEREIDGTDYRIDVGRAGTALCISTRSSGSWAWAFRGEARWQNGILRCKAFNRQTLSQLSTALAEAAADSCA